MGIAPRLSFLGANIIKKFHNDVTKRKKRRISLFFLQTFALSWTLAPRKLA